MRTSPLRRSGVDHTVLPANTPHLRLLRGSPEGATTEWTVIAPADEAYYSLIDPREDERLSWPCWLTYSRTVYSQQLYSCPVFAETQRHHHLSIVHITQLNFTNSQWKRSDCRNINKTFNTTRCNLLVAFSTTKHTTLENAENATSRIVEEKINKKKFYGIQDLYSVTKFNHIFLDQRSMISHSNLSITLRDISYVQTDRQTPTTIIEIFHNVCWQKSLKASFYNAAEKSIILINFKLIIILS